MEEQDNTVEQIETNLSKLKDVQKETLERAQKRWISRYKRLLSKAEDWISKHNSAKSSAATSGLSGLLNQINQRRNDIWTTK